MSYSIGQLPLPVNNCVEFQALEKCFMISFPIKQLVELLFCDNKYLLTRVFSAWDRMFKFKAITCNGLREPSRACEHYTFCCEQREV